MPILHLVMILFLSFTLYAEPPKASAAFVPSLSIIDPNTLGISIRIHDGVYLYQDKITIAASEGIHLGQYTLPKPTVFKSKQGKTWLVYQKELVLKLPMFGNQTSGKLQLRYQGCAYDGFCYPPQNKTIALQFAEHGGLTNAAWGGFENPDSTEELPSFGQRSMWFIGASFMLFGILLSFTPCVLPMIPVLVGIISGHAHISTQKGFALGSAYTLGIAISYSVVGAVFAYFGQNLQSLLQSPVAIISFAFLFILLAFSSMGVMKITLPSSIQARLANLNYHLPKNSLLGAFGMGALSTLILSPCVTPPLVGAIGFMVQTGNIYLGAFALFCMGIGIGLPLIVLSTAAGRYLPKAGHWMESIRFLIAYILLGVSVFLVCKLLSPVHSKMLVGLYLFFAGVLFGAFRRAFSVKQAFRQGLALLFLLYGLCLMLGASLGSVSYMHPLGHLHSSTTQRSLAANTVHTTRELDTVLSQTQGRRRVLFFTADWCPSCAVQKEALAKYQAFWEKHGIVFIFVDVTKRNQPSAALEARYQVIAPPTLLLLDGQGKPQSPAYVGDEAVDSLVKTLKE